METRYRLLFYWLMLDMSLRAIGSVAVSQTCSYIDVSEKNEDVSYDKIKCEENNICHKNFNVTYIGIVPYYHQHLIPARFTNVHDAVEDMLYKCCGNCAQYSRTTPVINNMEELTRDAINTSDFVFPVFARADTQHLYGFYYLPYHKAPSTYYVTKYKSDFLGGIVEVWPLLIITLLFALVAGFICWGLETWRNKEEFPRPFHVGLFEGIWWSFVSMTTVGYGDKAPRTVAGRLFSVIWIIFGIVAFGILAGAITGQVVKTNRPSPEKMDGKNVGILRYRDYETYVVSLNGGNIVRNSGVNDFVSDLIGLINKLMNDEIHGLLLDKYTLWFVIEMRTAFFTPGMLDFFIEETLFTEHEETGESLSYGILIRNTDDYNYFKDFVFDAVLRKTISWTGKWVRVKNHIGGNFYSPDGAITIFNTSSSIFKHTIIVLGAMILGMCVIGLFYELHRRKILGGCGKMGNSEQSNQC